MANRPKAGSGGRSNNSSLGPLFSALAGMGAGSPVANDAPMLQQSYNDDLLGNVNMGAGGSFINGQGQPIDMGTYQPYQPSTGWQRFLNPQQASMIDQANMQQHTAYIAQQEALQNALLQQQGTGDIANQQALALAQQQEQQGYDTVTGRLSAGGVDPSIIPSLVANLGVNNLRNGLYNAQGVGDAAHAASVEANARIPNIPAEVNAASQNKITGNNADTQANLNRFNQGYGYAPYASQIGALTGQSNVGNLFGDTLTQDQRNSFYQDNPSYTSRLMTANLTGDENRAQSAGLIPMMPGGSVIRLPSNGSNVGFSIGESQPLVNIPGQPGYDPSLPIGARIMQAPKSQPFSLNGGPLTLSNFGKAVTGGTNATPTNAMPTTATASPPTAINGGNGLPANTNNFMLSQPSSAYGLPALLNSQNMNSASQAAGVAGRIGANIPDANMIIPTLIMMLRKYTTASPNQFAQ